MGHSFAAAARVVRESWTLVSQGPIRRWTCTIGGEGSGLRNWAWREGAKEWRRRDGGNKLEEGLQADGGSCGGVSDPAVSMQVPIQYLREHCHWSSLAGRCDGQPPPQSARCDGQPACLAHWELEGEGKEGRLVFHRLHLSSASPQLLGWRGSREPPPWWAKLSSQPRPPSWSMIFELQSFCSPPRSFVFPSYLFRNLLVLCPQSAFVKLLAFKEAVWLSCVAQLLLPCLLSELDLSLLSILCHPMIPIEKLKTSIQVEALPEN